MHVQAAQKQHEDTRCIVLVYTSTINAIITLLVLTTILSYASAFARIPRSLTLLH